ncbi:MAG TPA: type II toxin-antitoxin system VapB family antitoxin [Longimicrobium sp.]|jgi:antitoxin VapB
MAINLDHPEADRLARELAGLTGESINDAVMQAVRERLAAFRHHRIRKGTVPDVSDIQKFVASLPDRDTRSADDILGYDEFGLPT